MNNDLISREALKKALHSNCDLCHDKNTNWCERCCPLNDFEDLIDNAPTVDIKDEIAGAYNEGFTCGNREAEKARLQGEWIKIGDIGLAYKCNKCGEVAVVPTNFCSKCGAKMKEKFERLVDETIPYGGVAVNDMRELIDNAPTVSDRYDEGYAQGYIDGSTGADWKGGAE